jgi:BirA family biotin operon repressor/biotin-[acetyl-CoA-carboxylase] ligase
VSLVTAIHYRAELDSTSNFLAGLVAGTPPGGTVGHGVLAIAGHQTAGRGRHGRRWQAPPGRALLFSILLDQARVPSAGLLPAAAGVAVVRAIRTLCPSLVPRLKWPNDVLIRGRKVCGILAEQSGQALILGIGINLHQAPDELPPETQSTSLAIELDRLHVGPANAPSGPTLLAAVLSELQALLNPSGGVDRTLQEFSACHDTIGRRVRVASPDPSRPVIEGLALAVDTDGALIVRLDHGPTVAVHSGDATLQVPAQPPESAPHPPGP